MENTNQDRVSIPHFQFLPGAVIGLTLVIFAAALFLVGQQLRLKIRAQITNRDGEILQAVAIMQQFADESVVDSTDSGEDLASQFVFLVKNTSPNKGMLAARLFDPAGRFVVPYPDYVAPGHLSPDDLPVLKQLKSVSRFHPATRVVDLLKRAPASPAAPAQIAPLLEVLIPIHASDQKALLGIAQFFMDGAGIAAQFATLDRYLVRQAALTFLAGGLIMVAALGWTFRRLQRARALLEARTADLVRANQELTLVAKTSAVGALTAHLIHGLKNPLFGLQTFMAGRGQAPSTGSDTEWQVAATTTRRMQTLINDVMRVLREENGTARYEVSLPELAETLRAKMQPAATGAGVQLLMRLAAEGWLANRDANLVILILENLLQNAVQATPRSRTVHLEIEADAETVGFEVRDEGCGFPPALEASLFSPCQSTKEGGSGIGLAISKQLANHLGAGLELKRNTAKGCVFALTLPAALILKTSAAAPQTTNH